MSHFAAFTKEPTCKFVIGQAEAERHVHPGPLKALSSSLSRLLIGPCKEATTGVVEFPEVEPQTFDLFIEYLYTSNYLLESASNKSVVTRSAFDEPLCGLTYYFCRWCREQYHKSQVVDGKFPFCSAPCKSSAMDTTRRKWFHSCAKCSSSLPSTGIYRVTLESLCMPCKQQQEAKKVEETAAWPRNSNLSSGFLKLDIKFKGMSMTDASEHLKARYPADLPSENLVAHAKLNRFADMYSMEELDSLTLLELHRDLKVLHPNEDNVSSVVELLNYVAVHTLEDEEFKAIGTAGSAIKQIEGVQGQSGGTLPKSEVDSASIQASGSPVSLRRLVLEYAIEQAVHLEQFEPFHKWVMKDGERSFVGAVLFGVARKTQERAPSGLGRWKGMVF